MTREEYEVKKAEIVKALGEPLWDLGAPANDSAKQLVILRGKMGGAWKKKHDDNADHKKDLKQAARDEAVKAGAGIAIPEIDIKENDLEPFSQEEKTIIKQFFSNIRQTHREIALETGTEYQKVTALLQSDAFKLLYTKVFDKILPITALAAVYAQLRLGNDKLAVDVLRDKGLMKNETIEHVARIEDPKAKAKLKTVGYELLDGAEMGLPSTTQTLQ